MCGMHKATVFAIMTDQSPTSLQKMQSATWRRALPMLVLVLVVILGVYRDTAMAMVETWSRTETFTHGFLVPPISLWLIWRIRTSIARLAPHPNYWVLLLLLGTGFLWLLGELATVGVVSQFALATLLVLSVPAVLGLQVARRITFPLAFLFFAVPFGEFALPQMMEWTANFTVLALRLTGIPVFREGLQFVIPSGNWSVVEACSGVRYLIASIVVGTLFAYLTYHSLKRRLIFVGVAIAVPLVANWLRAYMIVMLGHLSGNKLATGVDHLIYGWVFFGIVIMAMFWIGSRWREEELPDRAHASEETTSATSGHSSSLVAAIAVMVAVSIWPLAEWQINHTVAAPLSQIEPLEPIAEWPSVESSLPDWKPRFENPSASLQTTFGTNERQAGLYLGYYRNQDYSRKMVSSSNVMVTSSNPQWARVSSTTRPIEFGKQAISVRSAELRGVDTSRIIVWQWYWVNGHLTASDHVAKAYTALSRLTGQGDDSAVVFVYAPKEQGEAVLEAFVKAAEPAIIGALNRTRDKR